jgi:hypothetical protein
MTEFTMRLNADEDWDPGTSMLRKAALFIQQQLPQVIPIADCFAAFAIDWELEGDHFEAILKECGATDPKIAKLRSIGWLE